MGFQKIGHYDTWLIDTLQILVEHNHSVLLFPEWSNSSDFVSTAEKFGTVPIETPELTAAINSVSIPQKVLDKLTSDQRYLCKAMSTILPLLPVHGEAEYKLFGKLILALPSPINFDSMAIAWVKYVDGATIFPKLPVYLRTYHKSWQRNQRVRDAVKAAAPGADLLKKLNAATAPQPASASAPQTDSCRASAQAGSVDGEASGVTDTSVGAAATASATAPAAAAPPRLDINESVILAAAAATSASTDTVGATDIAAIASASVSIPSIRPHPAMPQPPLGMRPPLNPAIVGGAIIGGAPVPSTSSSSNNRRKRKHGERGEDLKPRKDRGPYAKCVACGDSANSIVCRGPWKRALCKYFSV